MKKKIDVIGTANMAIRFGISYPCCLCSYENSKTNECVAGIKYRGTCKVFRILKGELLKMREVKEDAEMH